MIPFDFLGTKLHCYIDIPIKIIYEKKYIYNYNKM